jgi:hypothetical protein
MVFNTLPPTSGAGGAITSPHLKKGASPLPNPPSPVIVVGGGMGAAPLTPKHPLHGYCDRAPLLVRLETLL